MHLNQDLFGWYVLRYKCLQQGDVWPFSLIHVGPFHRNGLVGRKVLSHEVVYSPRIHDN